MSDLFNGGVASRPLQRGDRVVRTFDNTSTFGIVMKRDRGDMIVQWDDGTWSAVPEVDLNRAYLHTEEEESQ